MIGHGDRVETRDGLFGRVEGDAVRTPSGWLVTVKFEKDGVTPSGGADYDVNDLRKVEESGSVKVANWMGTAFDNLETVDGETVFWDGLVRQDRLEEMGKAYMEIEVGAKTYLVEVSEIVR